MCVLGIKDELFGCWYKSWECPKINVKVADKRVKVAELVLRCVICGLKFFLQIFLFFF